MQPRIVTQHQWVEKLESMCPDLSSLNIKRKNDFRYVEISGEGKIFVDPDAYNFSNSNDHDKMLANTINSLLQKGCTDVVIKLLSELTYQKTYGSFSEFAVYNWLTRLDIEFSPQIALQAPQVINPNGSVLDGKMTLGDKLIYFDIKGFGFLEHKIDILKKKLEQIFNNKEALIEGSFDISIDFLQDLLEKNGFSDLVEELRHSTLAKRGPLEFRLRAKRRISTSTHASNPIELAKENKAYALRFYRQYTPNAPFFLFFVIHPWFSKGFLYQNFSGYTELFCTEFSKLSFHSFNDDAEVVEGIEKRQLVKLLSGIGFINAWPIKSEKNMAPNYIFLNTCALHKLNENDFYSIRDSFGDHLIINEI